MKKKILKKVGLLIIPLAMFFAAFASANEGDCTTKTIFWGESCCTYSGTTSTGAVVFSRKCCEYRLWIVWSCETVGAGPF